MSSAKLEGSVGKSRLQEMRDERYAQEAQSNYEFEQEARKNYEHGRHVREKMTQNARKGTSEVFSSSNSSVKLNQQQNRAVDRYPVASKENYNNMPLYDQYPQQQQQLQQHQQQQHQLHQNYSPNDSYGSKTSSQSGAGFDNCHDKYDAMLKNAAANRIKEKLSPRPTKFY